jgi:hypothetical protein
MTRLIPAEILQPETAPDDPRIGRLLGRQIGAGDRPDVVIIGFPSDEGFVGTAVGRSERR